MNIKDFIVGQKVYAIPTGNNIRRSSKKIEIFFVIDVKRKYVTLQKEESSYSEDYDPKTGATASETRRGFGTNAGYKFFKSLTELENHKQLTELRTFVRREITYNFGKLSETTLKMIAKDLRYTEKDNKVV